MVVFGSGAHLLIAIIVSEKRLAIAPEMRCLKLNLMAVLTREVCCTYGRVLKRSALVDYSIFYGSASLYSDRIHFCHGRRL